MIEFSASAVGQALELARQPNLAALMRNNDLPSDTIILIRIAAGCADTSDEVSKLLRLSPAVICDAAALFLHEILFHPASDYYRVLGVKPTAPTVQIRDHLHWLMKWLHPDVHARSWETPIATRVLTAWNAIKTPERRAAYDRGLKAKAHMTSQVGKKGKLVDGSRPTAMSSRRIRSELRPLTEIPWQGKSGGIRGPIGAIRKFSHLIVRLLRGGQKSTSRKRHVGGKVRR